MKKSRRLIVGVSAGSAGLVAGLALGVTGLANAATTSASSTPSTSSSASSAVTHHKGHHRGHRNGYGPGELVTAVSGNTLTLDTPGGVKTVAVTPATVYRRGQTSATLADVKPNEIVRVRFVDPTASSLVAKRVNIELARAQGYVAAVNGTSFTLVGSDGLARTVQESSTTVYRNAGAAGSPAEVAVGKLIRAQGNAEANGTTLDATRVETGKPQSKQHGTGS